MKNSPWSNSRDTPTMIMPYIIFPQYTMNFWYIYWKLLTRTHESMHVSFEQQFALIAREINNNELINEWKNEWLTYLEHGGGRSSELSLVCKSVDSTIDVCNAIIKHQTTNNPQDLQLDFKLISFIPILNIFFNYTFFSLIEEKLIKNQCNIFTTKFNSF